MFKRTVWKERNRQRVERNSFSGLPVEKKPLYFLPWNKSAFRFQTESWAWVLINIEQVSVHVSFDGLFSIVSFAPQVLKGRQRVLRVSTEVELLSDYIPHGTVACDSVCAWYAWAVAFFNVRGSQPGRAGAHLYYRFGSNVVENEKVRLWIFFSLKDGSKSSKWIKTSQGMNTPLSSHNSPSLWASIF